MVTHLPTLTYVPMFNPKTEDIILFPLLSNNRGPIVPLYCSDKREPFFPIVPTTEDQLFPSIVLKNKKCFSLMFQQLRTNCSPLLFWQTRAFFPYCSNNWGPIVPLYCSDKQEPFFPYCSNNRAPIVPLYCCLTTNDLFPPIVSTTEDQLFPSIVLTNKNLFSLLFQQQRTNWRVSSQNAIYPFFVPKSIFGVW